VLALPFAQLSWISMPIGIGPSGGEYGALVYLSFEHPLF
jgi:hypothetical protein